MGGRIILAITGVVAAASVFAAPDWSKVPARNIPLFYPGQAGLEWVMNVANHSSVRDIANKK